MIARKRWNEIGELDEGLWTALEALRVKNPWPDASYDRNVYLAAATLKDNRHAPCVAFVEKDSKGQSRLLPRHGFIRILHIFDDDKMIDVSTVLSIAPSPNVIASADLVRTLCEHGHFDEVIRHAKLTFSDGATQWTTAGYMCLGVGKLDSLSNSSEQRCWTR